MTAAALQAKGPSSSSDPGNNELLALEKHFPLFGLGFPFRKIKRLAQMLSRVLSSTGCSLYYGIPGTCSMQGSVLAARGYIMMSEIQLMSSRMRMRQADE